jgi:signal transduction histidine kinase
MKSPTFEAYTLKILRPYRIGVPIGLSVVVGILVGCSILALRANSDLNLGRALVPHLSNLVETKDRPELLRIVNSIAKERGAGLSVVRKGLVYAGSGAVSELDSPRSKVRALFSIGESQITKTEIVTEIPIRRPNGPDTESMLAIASPLSEILKSCLVVAGFFLLIGAFGSHMYSMRIAAAVKQAAAPLKTLDAKIPEMLLSKDPAIDAETYEVAELDRISRTIAETSCALSDATERAAEVIAKERIADGYRRLIHDLYTPVAALRETVRLAVADSNTTGDETRNGKVLRLAEQILNQVSVAKLNLGQESKVYSQEDIRRCVREGAEQAFLSYLNSKNVEISYQIPNEPIVIPHDPEHMRRAVSNLVSNAIRACRKQVEVVIENSSLGTTIRVSDDGDGLATEDVSLLLQGRKRVQKNERQSYGLPSVNHTARLHGGRVVYHKGRLGGACFELRLS